MVGGHPLLAITLTLAGCQRGLASSVLLLCLMGPAPAATAAAATHPRMAQLCRLHEQQGVRHIWSSRCPALAA
jgi:hypothetical protein